MVEALPFELVYRGNNVWRGYWAAEKLSVAIVGDELAPVPAALATVGALIARWAGVTADIAAFARALDGQHHVALDPASRGGFAARTCGFDQPLAFESLSVKSADAPARAVATFYTGFPDGYASYAVTLDGGTPVAISAFAS